MTDNPQEAHPIAIYASGPIDGIDHQEAQRWREALADEWPNVLFYLPTTAYYNTSPHTASLVDNFNRGAIYSSHGMIVNLSGPGRGLGTMREIEFARHHSKPVAVFYGDNPITYETLSAHDLYLAATPAEAMEHLLDAIRTNREAPRMAGIMLQFPGLPGFPMQDADDDPDD